MSRVALPAVVLVVAGCAGPLDRIDRDAGALIERRQALVLGEAAAVDAAVVPSPNPAVPREPPAGVYDITPATLNPDPAELPAVSEPSPTAAVEDVDPAALTTELPPLALDLEGVLGHAIQFAPDYRRQKEDLFLTTLSLLIERHRWGPRFFSTVQANVAGTPESGDYDTAFSLLADLGVTQRLPYGGQVSASVLADYVSFLQQSSGNTGSTETQSTAIDLSIGLPLLRGAGMAAREDLIQAERNLVYAVRDFERFRREFLVDLASTYFDLIFRQRSIATQVRQLRNLERTATQFRALADAGKIRGFQAEQIEIQVLSQRSALLRARENLANALDTFKITLGIPTERELIIVPTEVQVPEPTLDAVSAVQAALAYRLDLQTLADQTEDARRSVEVAENNTLADLDLDGRLRIPTQGDRDRGGVDFDLGEGDYRVGATLSLPLDRRIEQLGVRASLINLERAERNLRVQRDRTAVEVRNAIRAIAEARFTLGLQVRNVELAERRALEVSLRRRSLGPRDVIEAQQDLADARNTRDAAVADLRTAILEFLLATGQLRVSPEGRWLPPAQLVPVDDPLLDSVEEAQRLEAIENTQVDALPLEVEEAAPVEAAE